MWQSFWDWLLRVDFVSWDALSAIGQAVGAIGTLWAVTVALKQGKLAQKQTEYAQKQTDLALQQAEEQRKRAEKAELEAKEALKPKLTPRFEYIWDRDIICIRFINMKQVPAEIFDWDFWGRFEEVRNIKEGTSRGFTWSLKHPDIVKFQIPHRLRQGDYCTFEIPIEIIYLEIIDTEKNIRKFPWMWNKGVYWIYLKVDLLTGESYYLTILIERTFTETGESMWHNRYLFDITNNPVRMHSEGESFWMNSHENIKNLVEKWMKDRQRDSAKNMGIWLPPSYDRKKI